MRPAVAFYLGMSLVMGVTVNSLSAPWWVVLVVVAYGLASYVFGFTAPGRNAQLNSEDGCKG